MSTANEAQAVIAYRMKRNEERARHFHELTVEANAKGFGTVAAEFRRKAIRFETAAAEDNDLLYRLEFAA